MHVENSLFFRDPGVVKLGNVNKYKKIPSRIQVSVLTEFDTKFYIAATPTFSKNMTIEKCQIHSGKQMKFIKPIIRLLPGTSL